MMDSTKEGQHDRMHWGCCWMAMLGKALWILAFLDMVGAGIALWQGGEFLNVSVSTWFWFSLVKGVLAIGAKISKFHYCWHQR